MEGMETCWAAILYRPRASLARRFFRREVHSWRSLRMMGSRTGSGVFLNRLLR
jgi:hypothetical protein